MAAADSTTGGAEKKEEPVEIDRLNPQALCNWVETKRHVKGTKTTFYVNKVTGEERSLRPNVFTHGRAVTFAQKSLFLMSIKNPIREKVIFLITSKYFDNFILFTIVLNSIFLAIPDLTVDYGVDLEFDLDFKDAKTRSSYWENAYKIYVGGEEMWEANPSKSDYTNLTVESEIFFTVIFLVECLLKIVGMGFVMGHGAYLKDGWNVLDFIVVISGGLSQIPGFPRISALRTIRVMRPLRSLSVLPGMRSLINTLLNSIPSLMTVVTLLCFVFVIFGILAIQLWGGIQNYRCRISSKPLAIPDTTLVYVCNTEDATISKYYCEVNPGWEAKYGSEDVFDDAFECKSLQECVYEENRRLLSEYFGADDMEATATVVRKYAAAMVTRIFINLDDSVTPIHYCGYDKDGNKHNFPSFNEGYFPDHVGLAPEDGGIDNLNELSTETIDDGLKPQQCFWPIYEDGRVCSKEGIGLGGGLNECGHAEMAFPSAHVDWLLPDSVTTRAIWADSSKEDGSNIDEDVKDSCAKDPLLTAGDVSWKSYFDKQVAGAADGSDAGRHPQCYDIESYHGERRDNAMMFVHTTCGSNFDYWGNERFANEALQEFGHYQEDLAFGYIRFNWIMPACMTIFQAITEEGWTDIMYQIMDADNYVFASLYFCLLIIFGSFVCLNLTLAVLWAEFDDSRKGAEQEARRAANVRAQYSAGTKAEAEEKEAEDEKKEAEEAATAEANALSWYLFGCKGSQRECGIAPVVMAHDFVSSKCFEIFIVACILINTATLSMDSYSQRQSEAEVFEIINFLLTLIFIIEMVLKLFGLGLREYVADSFNRFDAVIVLGSIVELALLPPSFVKENDGASGGALSALRAFRLFRLFKLARSWKSLHHLLSTMVNTLDKLGNFALLLLLFIYIFALVGLQFFANRFRFGDDGHHIELTVGPLEGNPEFEWNADVPLYGMKTSMWKDKDVYLNPEFMAADVPRAHFDDVYWSATTIFQVLSGENWNTVMYDGRRSTTWLACFFFVVLIVLGIMIVLELFVAVLLGEFENNDDDDEEQEEEGGEEGKKEEKFGGTGMINGAHAMTKHVEDGSAGKGTESLDEFSFIERICKWIDCGGVDAEKAGAKVVPVEDEQSGTATKTVEGEEAKTGGKTVTFDEGAKEGDTAKQALIVTDPLADKLKGRAFWMSTDNPARRMVGKVVFHPWFDQVILVLIILSSIMLAIETPLDDPDSTRSLIFGKLDLIFTIAFIVELCLKHMCLGIRQYWSDSWNVLDGLIVAVSIVVLASNGDSSLSSLRALRTLRVLRPLRMINRAPGLKRVVNALLFSIPKIVDVLVVCALFFLIFAIVGINFLKGKLNMCSGDLTGGEEHFLHQLDWDKLDSTSSDFDWTYQQRLIDSGSPFATCVRQPEGATYSGDDDYYFDADGKFVFNFQEIADEDSIYSHWNGDLNGTGAFDSYDSLGDWQEATLPYNFNTDKNDVSCSCVKDKSDVYRWKCLTSKDACYGLKLAGKDVDWEAVVYQSFDNILLAMSCLFEISTTEGWVDVMYAAVDAEGIDMQPDRKANHMVWVVFFVAFIICGSFFVLNLFVGVVCDTFNEMRVRFGSDFLMTERQKEWVKMRKKINKLGPYLKAHVMKTKPEGWREPIYSLVTNPLFDHTIMTCIIVNTVFMSIRHFGQANWVEVMLMVVNYIFAIIFTVEAILKVIGLQMRYFDDGWNIFDFTIVVATDLFILVRLTTDLDLVSLATVMRTFRVLRVFRLIQSAKELRKLINTLIISLPQLGNIAMLLLLCLFIFAVMGVQMFAKIALEDAYNEHANFQNFGVAILTLMRSTTGENWNGMMYSMVAQTDGCVGDPSYDPLLCGMEDAIEECLPLNGCGSKLAFPYWLLFTMLVSFVVLNVFVAVILEAFENSGEDEDATLTDAQWKIFCGTWMEFVPKMESSSEKEALEAAFRIEMTQLLPLFKKLPYPMGFRQADGTLPGDKQCMDDLHQMDIDAVRFGGAHKQGLWAEFWTIALACAKRVMVYTSDGDYKDLLQELHDAEHIERQASGRHLRPKSHKDAVVQLNAKQYFAALRIACAFRSHKFREKIAERVTVQQNMESMNNGGAHH